MQPRAAFSAALFFALTACAFNTPTSYPGLEGTRWQLVSVSGRTLTVPEGQPIKLGFQDSRVIFHGCNGLSGRYSQEGTRITVSKGFISTKMRCADELMEIDNGIREIFHQGVRFTLYDTTLVLETDTERWAFKSRTETAAPPTEVADGGA